MTDRQRAFLDAYLADRCRNATRAAAAAGYAWPAKQGARLKTLPGLAEAIRADDERIEQELEALLQIEMKAERARERAEKRDLKLLWEPPKRSRRAKKRRRRRM